MPPSTSVLAGRSALGSDGGSTQAVTFGRKEPFQ
jgi:hypothetical protein